VGDRIRKGFEFLIGRGKLFSMRSSTVVPARRGLPQCRVAFLNLRQHAFELHRPDRESRSAVARWRPAPDHNMSLYSTSDSRDPCQCDTIGISRIARPRKLVRSKSAGGACGGGQGQRRRLPDYCATRTFNSSNSIGCRRYGLLVLKQNPADQNTTLLLSNRWVSTSPEEWEQRGSWLSRPADTWEWPSIARVYSSGKDVRPGPSNPIKCSRRRMRIVEQERGVPIQRHD